MDSWPDAPLIRITLGSLRGVPLRGALAASARLAASGASFGYQIIQGPGTGRLIRRDDPDSGSILAWEEVVPVPAADLERLRSEFRGAPASERRLRALLQVTSHLPASTSSPLDKAVSKVEESLSLSMALVDLTSEEYLALLLGALSDFQELENESDSLETERTLSRIVSLCVEWIAEVSSGGSPFEGQGRLRVLAEARARVESDPATGGFLAMAGLAGDAATWIEGERETGEGRQRLAAGLAEPVLTIAHYALALLAENLRDGE